MQTVAKISCLFLLMCLTARASNGASGTGDLAGAWLVRSDVFEVSLITGARLDKVMSARNAQPNLLIFKHRGASWSGTMTTSFGTMQLENIVVEGPCISFDEVFDLGIGPVHPIKVWGVLEDGELQLHKFTAVGRSKIEMCNCIVRTYQVASRASLAEVTKVEVASPKATRLPPLPDNGLARTPPMGWNSWNKFGRHIDDKAVREVADALVNSGLRDDGYVYVIVDDSWQGKRDAHGVLHSNSRFPNMKALGDYIHARGLKFGIYSSPGPMTCGRYEGSQGYEQQDARMFASWGVDYLKYDWCTADALYSTPAELQAAYRKMGEALQATGRPIVYALCEYGLFEVGKWGRKVGANSWRTTFDILDTWKRMSRIGFQQNGNEVYAGPGGWNDPDMLEVGNGGMNLEEDRTHFTLWAMRSAPLILGNDVRSMKPAIKTLLTNKEVIAIDQDPLGKQGRRITKEGAIEGWTKPLADGSIAVAFFNRGATSAKIEADWHSLGLAKPTSIRDLWHHVNLDPTKGFSTTLPPHGTALLRVMQ